MQRILIRTRALAKAKGLGTNFGRVGEGEVSRLPSMPEAGVDPELSREMRVGSFASGVVGGFRPMHLWWGQKMMAGASSQAERISCASTRNPPMRRDMSSTTRKLVEQYAGRYEAQDLVKQLGDLSAERISGGSARHRLRAIEVAAMPIVETFDALQLAMTIGAYSKMRERPGKEMLEALLAQTAAHVEDLDALGISIVLHGYAKMGVLPGKDLMDVIEDRATIQASHSNSQSVTNLLQAYALLRLRPGRELVSELELAIVALMDGFQPIGIVNTLWAYAKIKIKPGSAVVAAMERQARFKAGQFNPQDISKLMWSLSAMKIRPEPATITDIEEQVVIKIDGFGPQNVSNTLLAYSKLNIVPGHAALHALMRHAAATMHLFNSQALCNTVWSLGTFRTRADQQLIESFEVRVESLKHELLPQNLTNFLGGFASLGAGRLSPTAASPLLSMTLERLRPNHHMRLNKQGMEQVDTFVRAARAGGWYSSPSDEVIDRLLGEVEGALRAAVERVPGVKENPHISSPYPTLRLQS